MIIEKENHEYMIHSSQDFPRNKTSKIVYVILMLFGTN